MYVNSEFESEARAATRKKHITSQVFPVLFIITMLLSGSLINNLPGQDISWLNLTSNFINCLWLQKEQQPLLPLSEVLLLNNSNDNWNTTFTPTSISTPQQQPNKLISFLVVGFSLVLPLAFDFVKQQSLFDIFNSQTFLPVYNHIAGQTLSFSSGEILRHFLFFPQIEKFVNACNLTEQTCYNYENKMISTDTLCLNMNQWDIFNSLHSLPNVILVMVGAAFVSLAINYMYTDFDSAVVSFATNNTAATTDILMEDTRQTDVEINKRKKRNDSFLCNRNRFHYRKVNYCLTTQYFKFILLTVYILVVFIYIWESLQNFPLSELILSFGQGLIVQTCVCYALKQKDVNFVPLLSAK